MAKKLWLNEQESIQIPETRAIDLSEVASRERSIDFTMMGSYLPNPDPVLKLAGIDQKTYRELLVDPHVAAVVSSRKAGVQSMQWEIDPNGAPQAQAEFIQGAFKDEFDCDKTISQTLDAPPFGYQILEVMWQKRGDFALPKRVVGKPPEWFVFSPENELLFRTRDNWMGEPLKPMKFLLARHEDTYLNPYGFPVLSRAFWWVTFKKGGVKFWLTFAEKYGMPFAVGKIPAGRDEKFRRELLKGMKLMIQDAAAVINDDESIELLESGGKTASSDLFKSLCEYCDTQISKGIVGQTLTTEVGQNGGAYAASQTHNEVRGEIVEGDKKIVEGVMNQLIRWLVQANFATTGPMPLFKLFHPEDLTGKATLYKQIYDLGARFTEACFEEEFNLKKEHFTLPPAPTGVNPALMPPEGGPPPGPPRLPGASQFGAPPDLSAPRRVLSPHALHLHFGAAPAALPDALDKAIDGLSAEDLQAEAEGLLKPIWPLIEKGATAEALSEGLLKAYPDMEDKAYEEALTRAIFVANLWGHLTAGEG